MALFSNRHQEWSCSFGKLKFVFFSIVTEQQKSFGVGSGALADDAISKIEWQDLMRTDRFCKRVSVFSAWVFLQERQLFKKKKRVWTVNSCESHSLQEGPHLGSACFCLGWSAHMLLQWWNRCGETTLCFSLKKQQEGFWDVREEGNCSQMKVESNMLVSCALRARASKSCFIRADFSFSSWAMRSLLSVTSLKRQEEK